MTYILRWALLASAMLSLLTSAPAETLKFRMMKKGKQIGTSSFSVMKSGTGWIRSFEWNLVLNGVPFHNTKEIVYDKSGQWHTQTFEQRRGSDVVSCDAVLKGRVAQATVTVNNGYRSENIPAPAGAAITTEGSLWFAPTAPKVGATRKQYIFNITKLQWEALAMKYSGKGHTMLAKASATGHELQFSLGPNGGRMWIDKSGHLLAMEFEGIRYERTAIIP